MFKIEKKNKSELPKELLSGGKWFLPENGSGSEYATYLVATHNGKIIFVASDAMEPEDARFGRDLSWIIKEMENIYNLGFRDGQEDKIKEVDEFYNDDMN